MTKITNKKTGEIIHFGYEDGNGSESVLLFMRPEGYSFHIFAELNGWLADTVYNLLMEKTQRERKKPMWLYQYD